MTTPQGPDDGGPGPYGSGTGPGGADAGSDGSAGSGGSGTPGYGGGHGGSSAAPPPAAPVEPPPAEPQVPAPPVEREQPPVERRDTDATQPVVIPEDRPSPSYAAPPPVREPERVAAEPERPAPAAPSAQERAAAGHLDIDRLGDPGPRPAPVPPLTGTPSPAAAAAAAAAGAGAGTAAAAGAARREPARPQTPPRETTAPAAGKAGQGGKKKAGTGNPAAAQPLKTGKTRRARLVIRRVDPWSVLKFSLLFSLCLLIVFVVAVAALYYALDSLGVFDSVNQFVRDVTQAGPEGRPTGGFDVTFSPGKVIGGAAVLGAINVVIITAISTLGAFLYNLCSDIVGGIEVTLAERD